VTDDRDKSLLADWANHPGHAVMRKRLIEARETYYRKLGETLYRNPDTLTADDLKGKSAFFRGALWVLNEPVFARKEIERALANEGETDE
jgi:hypothetical protein